MQLTDFENAAYVVFIVLLTRVILSFDLDLIIPISKVRLLLLSDQPQYAIAAVLLLLYGLASQHSIFNR